MSKSVKFYRAKDEFGRSELRALPRPDGAVFAVTRSQFNARRWNVATHVAGFTALRIVTDEMSQSDAKALVTAAVELHGENGATARVYALAKLRRALLETQGSGRRERLSVRIERVTANLLRGDGVFVPADASGDGFAYVLDKPQDARTELVKACDAYRGSGSDAATAAENLERVKRADAAVQREQEDARLGIDWTRAECDESERESYRAHIAEVSTRGRLALVSGWSDDAEVLRVFADDTAAVDASYDALTAGETSTLRRVYWHEDGRGWQFERRAGVAVNEAPRIHSFASSGEAYDASQTHEDIADGDILLVPSERACAVLVSAWPTAVEATARGRAFHVLNEDASWRAISRTAGDGVDDYSPSARVAAEVLAELRAGVRAAHALDYFVRGAVLAGMRAKLADAAPSLAVVARHTGTEDGYCYDVKRDGATIEDASGWHDKEDAFRAALEIAAEDAMSATDALHNGAIACERYASDIRSRHEGAEDIAAAHEIAAGKLRRMARKLEAFADAPISGGSDAAPDLAAWRVTLGSATVGYVSASPHATVVGLRSLAKRDGLIPRGTKALTLYAFRRVEGAEIAAAVCGALRRAYDAWQSDKLEASTAASELPTAPQSLSDAARDIVDTLSELDASPFCADVRDARRAHLDALARVFRGMPLDELAAWHGADIFERVAKCELGDFRALAALASLVRPRYFVAKLGSDALSFAVLDLDTERAARHFSQDAALQCAHRLNTGEWNEDEAPYPAGAHVFEDCSTWSLNPCARFRRVTLRAEDLSDVTPALANVVADWTLEFAADTLWQNVDEDTIADVWNEDAATVFTAVGRVYDGGIRALVSDALALPRAERDAEQAADKLATEGFKTYPSTERQRFAVSARIARKEAPRVLELAAVLCGEGEDTSEDRREIAERAADVLVDADALTAAELVKRLPSRVLELVRVSDVNVSELLAATLEARSLRERSKLYRGRGELWSAAEDALLAAVAKLEEIAREARGHLRANQASYFAGDGEDAELGMPRAE